MNKIGKSDKYVIYEGLTEEKFLQKMQIFFENQYNLILKNSKGKDNIMNEYKKIKRKNSYSDVSLMYDLDNIDNVSNIIKFYKKNGIKILKNDIYFINPSFEILFVLIKENRTPVNKYELHIKRLYDVNNYTKTDKQLTKIITQISKNEIINLMKNIKKLMNRSDITLRSTNYDILFEDLFNIK